MTDVRLTAINPVDSQVYPVACNSNGELIVDREDPGPDLTVTGDLTVDGVGSFAAGNFNIQTWGIAGNGDLDLYGSTTSSYGWRLTSGANLISGTSYASPLISLNGTTGSANFSGSIQLGEDPVNGNDEGVFIGFNGDYQSCRASSTGTLLTGYLKGVTAPTFVVTAGGTITCTADITSSNGDITCSDNTKGLVLKSPNGTAFRLSVANDGTVSASGI